MEISIPHTVHTYYDLHLPNPDAAGVPLLIATHGYSGDKRSMMRLAKKVDSHGRFAIASLQGIHQHFKRLGDPKDHKQDIGFGWFSPWKPEESKQVHHESIDAIIRRLTVEGVIDPKRVFLMGFSQSVALNMRYALTYPGTIRGLVGICGGIPFDLETNSIYHKDSTDVLAVHMDKDEFYPPDRVEENVARLRTYFNNLSVETLEGGHTISPGMFPLIENWLSARLGNL